MMPPVCFIQCILLIGLFGPAGVGLGVEPSRTLQPGKIVLQLAEVPPPGGKERAEFDLFLKLNPDIILRSATGITVENVGEAHLFLAMAADRAPDVFKGALRDVQTYYQQGFLYPLDDFYNRDKAQLPSIQANVAPVIYQNGRLVALPAFYKVMALLHRRDLFEKFIGRDTDRPPRDWDEWFRWSLKLTRPEEDLYGMSIRGGAWLWEIFVWLAGGEMARPFKVDPKSGEWIGALAEAERYGAPQFPEVNPATGARLKAVPVTWRATCDDLSAIRALNFYRRLLWVEWFRPSDTGQELIFVDYPDYDRGKAVVATEVKDPISNRTYRLKRGDPARPSSDRIVDDHGVERPIFVGAARWYSGRGGAPGQDFKEGKIAMLISAGGRDAVFDREYAPSLVGLTAFAPGPPPQGRQATELNAFCLCMNSQIKDPRVREAAWRWMKFQCGPERRRLKVKEWVEEGLAAYVLAEWLEKYGFADYVEEAPKSWAEQNRLLESVGRPEAGAPGFRAAFRELDHALDRICVDPRRDAATELKSAVTYVNRFLLSGKEPSELRKQRKIAWGVAAAAGLALAAMIRQLWIGMRAQAGAPSAGLIAGPRARPRHHAMAWTLMLPALALVAVFQYYPLCKGSIMAFQDYYILGSRRFVGLDNFITVLTSASFWHSVAVTFEYVALSMSVGFVAPIFLAIALSEIPRLKYFYRTIYFLPSVTSGLVIAFLWKQLFDPTPNGILNQLLASVGLDPCRWLQDPSLAMLCVVLPSIWAGAGPGCLLYLAALKIVSDDLYEAADLDGAGWWQKIRHVMFPAIFPLIAINFIGAFIGAFHGMHNIFVMTAGGPDRATHVLGLEIWFNAFLYLKFGYAAAMAWVLAAALVGFVLWQMKLLKKMEFRTAEG
ncbi:MAG: extracellular solute-binding protein [Verrucomicrobia bacterium]|nr:extracellular solute-binding protein [Verrucomicrobiota bacterium]